MQTSGIDKQRLEPTHGFGETYAWASTMSLFVALLFVLILETLSMLVLLGASILHSILFSLVAMAVFAVTLLAVDWLMTNFGREIKARYTRFSHQLSKQSVESPVGRPLEEATASCVEMKSRHPQATGHFDE